ncbi:hypothetical protein [Pontibacter pamirensis]|uniref:hypothetical protein n=1 Tax=Pontibacter pamirensis TaxID=2562824 RepID=UPI0013895004|nr:hypothetical protein [Pontibacter pamirensis]
MKKTYAFIVAGTMLMSGGLISCTGENTTGVDTETTNNEVDGRLNDPEGGAITEDNISPLDTANNPGADTTLDSTTPRTTTPATDNGF